MHEGYEKYLDLLKERGLTSPMSEKQWREAVGIPEVEYVPLIARKSSADPKKVKPTLQNHEEVKAPRPTKAPKPKKPKAVRVKKEPRKKMTPDEARDRRNQLERERRAAKRKALGIKPREKRTEAEKKAYQKEYMARWRKLHPKAAYENTLKWRREHPEEYRKLKREETRRRRERLKNG